jgi:CRP-like cAMP-binding protein
MITPSSPFAPLLLGVQFQSSRLDEPGETLLRSLAAQPRRRYDVHARLAVEGAPLHTPQLMVSGWACRARVLADGRRQILGLVLPGDVVGSQSGDRDVETSTTVALTPVCTVDAVHVRALQDADHGYMPIREAVALARRQEEYFLTCQIVRLGRQTALERLGHLLLELEFRLAARGLAHEGRFALPLTQETLADVLGLSVVHINRTLQQMRRDGLLDLLKGWLTLKDKEGLRALAEFRAPEAPTLVEQVGHQAHASG